MKILLLCPASETTISKNDYYPIGLLYLARILEQEGHQVVVKDYYKRQFSDYRNVWNEVKKIIKTFQPEVVGISSMTMNRVCGFKISKAIKKMNPKIKIILGGVHATSMYKQILENLPVDFIVLNEGEINFPKLIEALDKKKSFKKLKGIAFKEKSEVKFNGPGEFISDLDEIPFPKHELCKNTIRRTRTANMITSRGCPYGCIFCSTSAYWGRKWRARSAENVVSEIEEIVKKFPYVRKICFHDDTFVLDNQRVIDICNLILKRDLKIKWSCAARVDRISEEMLKKMKEAGCTDISYGVESGSEKMLKIIDKKITKEQIKRTIALTNKVGIKYHVFLMVGNPGETWETVKETSKFLDELQNCNVTAVGRLELYPNTKAYEIAKNQKFINDSFWMTEKKVPHYTYENSEKELSKMVFYIIAKNRIQSGLLNFLSFSLKFFWRKPIKVLKFLVSRTY